MSVDGYNLPVGILGLHDEEFYGAVGRIVCVCAVLEQQLTTMRHSLAHAEQGRFTNEPVSAQIRDAQSLSEKLQQQAGDRVRSFLESANSAFERRNQIVHSAFPAQPGGSVWGHRPTRDKTIVDGSADTVETSVADLKAYVAELSGLVQDFAGVFAYCN
jgi:hypothetical protein